MGVLGQVRLGDRFGDSDQPILGDHPSILMWSAEGREGVKVCQGKVDKQHFKSELISEIELEKCPTSEKVFSNTPAVS